MANFGKFMIIRTYSHLGILIILFNVIAGFCRISLEYRYYIVLIYGVPILLLAYFLSSPKDKRCLLVALVLFLVCGIALVI